MLRDAPSSLRRHDRWAPDEGRGFPWVQEALPGVDIDPSDRVGPESA